MPMTDDELGNLIRAGLIAAAESLEIQIRIGITGTRELPTNAQQHTLGAVINRLARNGPSELHHGCCVGTDECAHFIGSKLPDMQLIGHPGTGRGGNSPYRMKAGLDLLAQMLPPLPYGKRNYAIVQACNVLIACPQFPEHDTRSARSGTWQTIRIARRKHQPVIIILANGLTVTENETLGEL